MKQLITQHNAGDIGHDYVPSFGMLKHSLLERDLSFVTHIVFHTTGVGVYRREEKLKALGLAKDMLEVTTWTYQNIMPDSGHFVIGENGDIAQTVPVKFAARHVGASRSNAYRSRTIMKLTLPSWYTSDELSGLETAQRFTSLQSAWRMGSCNKVSIGIELVMPRHISDPLPPEQLAPIVALLSRLKLLVPAIKYITTHSHVHPIARTVKGQPYDLTAHHHEQLKTVIPELV